MGRTELYFFGVPHKNTLFLWALWSQWDSAFAYKWVNHNAYWKQLAQAAVRSCNQYKCLAGRYKCSHALKKILKHLLAQAYRWYSSFIQALVSESLLWLSYFLLLQDIEISLTQRQDMHIYMCFIRTTNLEKMQNILREGWIMLTFQIPNSPLFSEQWFKVLVSEELWKGHLLMCSIYLFMTKCILKTACVLDLENVVRIL